MRAPRLTERYVWAGSQLSPARMTRRAGTAPMKAKINHFLFYCLIKADK